MLQLAPWLLLGVVLVLFFFVRDKAMRMILLLLLIVLAIGLAWSFIPHAIAIK